MNNLYWSIYKNLEREVLDLADMIHFDDNQLSVYSVRIADLLIRCAVEIEAISKELYEQSGGNTAPLDGYGNTRSIFFDTDCLDLLEGKWMLSKKQVNISNINSYFTNDENRILTPLKNANKRGKCDWKQAYQAVKHNRSKNLGKGNIKSLLRALAALYILNIYYRDESFLLNRHQKLPDESLDSSIFSVKTAVCSPRFPENEVTLDEEALGATYIIKSTNTSYSKYYKEAAASFNRQKEAALAAGYNVPKNEDGEDEDISYNDIYQIAIDIGGADLVKRISEMEQTALKVYDMFNYEAVLNKNPVLSFSTKESGGNPNG